MRACWLIVLVAACNAPDRGPKWQPAGAATPRDGGTLRFAAKDAIRTLDPAIAYDEIAGYALQPLFDTLVAYEHAGLGLRPGLASVWQVSDDGRTYHFGLRPGIAYSDGRAIVAGDFKYAMERVLSLADSPFGAFLGDVVGASDVIAGKATACAGITTPSDRELVIELTRPTPAFLYVMTMKFTAPQRADHVAAAGDQIRRRPLASGPYMLESWDEGTRIVLVRNPHYWDPHRAHLDSIVMVENIPRDTQFLMFERGELDTAERLAAPDYLWITSQPAWKPYVHTRALMNAYGSRMNVRVKPFSDRRVRQALNYAVDKAHTTKLLNGGSVPSHGLLAPGMWGRDDSLAPYPHDPAKARALLAEAGYPNGFETEYVTINDEEAEKLAASLQGDLAEVGVRVHITLMSFATYVTAIGKPGGPPFSLGSWIGDYPDPTSFFDTQFHSRMIADENSNNVSFYANPELDALLDAARGEREVARREAMYHRVEHILYDDAPWVWDYHRLMTEVTQPYVRNYEPHPVWIRDYTETWLDLGADGEPVPR